jgi:hypothetical protein
VSRRRAKVPRTPPAPLTLTATDITDLKETLWRVHRTTGPHVLSWSELRDYGPLGHMRYDPHPPGPATAHPGFGVSYAALDVTTAVAEAFATTRLIDVTSGAPHATAWTPARKLDLLDLGGDWPLRNGAASALTAANRPVCRAWAHAIHTELRSVDGLLAPSTMTGRPIVVLWDNSADSFPSSPEFSRPLSHPLLWTVAQQAAEHIGYRITT